MTPEEKDAVVARGLHTNEGRLRLIYAMLPGEKEPWDTWFPRASTEMFVRDLKAKVDAWSALPWHQRAVLRACGFALDYAVFFGKTPTKAGFRDFIKWHRERAAKYG
jgi:hypothetical protein